MATGRAKGGIARAKSLTAEQRKEIARKAASERWNKDIQKAGYIGELQIGNLILPCAVLPDGTRVISQGGITSAFGPVTGGYQSRKKTTTEDGGDLPPFLIASTLKSFISNELRTLVSSPINYRDPRGGPIRNGIDASLLPQICEVWLNAKDAGALTKIQEPVAARANILMRGLAHTGIIALVDEATGYQEIRDRKALQIILEKYINDEWAKWTKTFPDEFYKELFRLKRLEYPTPGGKKPQYVGHWTNSIIYSRLAPGVREELKKKNPREPKTGKRKHKDFQFLTEDYGTPELKDLLSNVIFLMSTCDTWDDFQTRLDKVKPKYGNTIEMDV